MTERQLQIQIVKWLRSRSHLAIHVPNEGKRTARESAIAKMMGVLAGVSDILVLDTFTAIEVKLPGQQPTKAQSLFLSALKACGWTVGVARSLEDAQRIMGESIDGK